MNRHRLRAALVSAAALAAALLHPTPVHAQSGVEHKLVVGVFSRSYLVQAFYRSGAWKAKVTELMSARNDAAVASDTAKVDQIDKQLADLQTLAQRQLAGQAPLTNILDALKDQWPAIAQEAGVDVIVDQPLYVAPDAALVDVTPTVVKHLSGKP